MYRFPYIYPYSQRAPFPPPIPHWPHYPPIHPYQQPPHWPMIGQHSPQITPYPKPSPMLKPPSGVPAIISQFKTSEGTYDINKMMNTVGQMINTVNQVNSVLKGLISTFKK
ncbi:YppG family protein [Anoxybacteroides amylolyticum]|uniref:YppG-like family protein n=1 Tax=Anoxybacteroides amylolyticum TaxID=294699 RepID=A0A160F6U2_9BACL|nr:YppG family protein [Anoxybacillus amylolyticus]ANB61603.1 yppG-like family protein [Anoxybacillus amylolyticus]